MDKSTLQRWLNDRFDVYGDRCALEVDGTTFTYASLKRWAIAGARAMVERGCSRPFVVVFGYRSPAAYVGVLSALMSGKAYLPVSHKFPAQRLAEVFEISKSDTLILGKEMVEAFRGFLDCFDGQLPELNVLYLPDEIEAIELLIRDFPRHVFVPIESAAAEVDVELPESGADDYAYMLFTSGSTGKPKGIAITHENVCAYLEYVLDHFDFQPDDRFSLTFDLTFDYSVHDMFCCWLSGACLCVVPATSLMAPAKFIESKGITVWFSVPSLVMTMEKLRMLRPGRFPNVRLSFFGGEAVSRGIVESWQAAAPNSKIFNVYGPTEATINITHYQWDATRSPEDCVNDGVPLGECFRGHQIRIIDEQGAEVPVGAKGQLVVSGPQVARGYYRDEGRTAKVFREIPDGGGQIWYFTGDLASRDATGTIRYFGRLDFQVQICGYRIELAEIEALLRKAAETEFAVALPWPFRPDTGRADYLVAVLAKGRNGAADSEQIMRLCRDKLPDYAVPSKLIYLDDFPLNINGKVDRGSIARILREELL